MVNTAFCLLCDLLMKDSAELNEKNAVETFRRCALVLAQGEVKRLERIQNCLVFVLLHSAMDIERIILHCASV